jgi:hypothetical protein
MYIPFTGRDRITTANYSMRFFKMPWNPRPVNFFVQILRNPIFRERQIVTRFSEFQFDAFFKRNPSSYLENRSGNSTGIGWGWCYTVAELRCDRCTIRPHLPQELPFLNCVFRGVLPEFGPHCTESTSSADLKHDPT